MYDGSCSDYGSVTNRHAWKNRYVRPDHDIGADPDIPQAILLNQILMSQQCRVISDDRIIAYRNPLRKKNVYHHHESERRMASHLHAEDASIDPIFHRQTRAIPRQLNKREIPNRFEARYRPVHLPKRIRSFYRIPLYVSQASTPSIPQRAGSSFISRSI